MWSIGVVVGLLVVIFSIYLVYHRAERTRHIPVDGPNHQEAKLDFQRRLISKHTQIQELGKGLREKSHICVSDLMTEHVTKVNESTSRADIRDLMSTHRTRHLLVENDAGLLAGIISDRDLSQRRGKTAKEIMTPDPCSCLPSSPIGEALALMLGKRISCLPVVERYQARGVITTTDLLAALECLLELLERDAPPFSQLTQQSHKHVQVELETS